MNNLRRKWLESIIEKLTEQKDELVNLIEEEQEAYDNIPESLQESEHGQAMYDAIYDLSAECDALEDIAQNLQEIMER